LAYALQGLHPSRELRPHGTPQKGMPLDQAACPMDLYLEGGRVDVVEHDLRNRGAQDALALLVRRRRVVAEFHTASRLAARRRSSAASASATVRDLGDPSIG